MASYTSIPGSRAANLAILATLILLAIAPAAMAQNQAPAQPPTAGPPQQQPQQRLEPTGETFGDWQLLCTVPEGQAANPPPPSCFIQQRFVDPNSQRPILIVTIGQVRASDQRAALLAMPLGIPLSEGLLITVDGREVKRLQFEVCRRDGCQAYVPIDDALLSAFKAGNEATASVRSSRGGAINVPFSLRGFTAGYARVQ